MSKQNLYVILCNLKNPQLITNPVSRSNGNPPELIRDKLDISDDKSVMLITMGGIQDTYSFTNQLPLFSDTFFIVPGGSDKISKGENFVLLLPHRPEYYHPDLINSAYAVISKIGYSTLAEAFYTGCSLGYILRPGFRESDQIIPYIKENFNRLLIPESEFYSGSWMIQTGELKAFP